MNESNVENVVQKDNFLYFVAKDAKDKPLESQCKIYKYITIIVKLPIPDKKFEIKDENIPNLRKLLSKTKPKENG